MEHLSTYLDLVLAFLGISKELTCNMLLDIMWLNMTLIIIDSKLCHGHTTWSLINTESEAKMQWNTRSLSQHTYDAAPTPLHEVRQNVDI